MAPALAHDQQPSSRDSSDDLTSGQYSPLFDSIGSFESFPDSISGPTVWTRDEYINQPERWIHRFTEDEVADIGRAADEFQKSGLPLTKIDKENFRLGPKLEQLLTTTKKDLVDGKGFVLFKVRVGQTQEAIRVHVLIFLEQGFPVCEWTVEKSAAAYMGIGSHLGQFVYVPASIRSKGSRVRSQN
jgi:hypothetical protein